jgi:hypothetical protein
MEEERGLRNINPMFSHSKPKATSQKTKPLNVRNQPKKTRSDKKHDIRISVSPETKVHILKLAENSPSVTQYCTSLISKSLNMNYEASEVRYVNYDEIVHAKVSQEQYKQIYNLKIKWKCRSVRQAAQRLLLGMLKLEKGEITIEKF